MNWKLCGVFRVLHKHVFFSEGGTKTTTNFYQYGRLQDRNFNPGPPEYEELQRSVRICRGYLHASYLPSWSGAQLLLMECEMKHKEKYFSVKI
jgi:hypothetical protein